MSIKLSKNATKRGERKAENDGAQKICSAAGAMHGIEGEMNDRNFCVYFIAFKYA